MKSLLERNIDMEFEMTAGMVFDIKKFAVQDGPGIRTTVFLKGCPLQCLWCHNPESQKPEPELSLRPDRCIACGKCRELCPVGAIRDGVFDQARCISCGKCAAQCHAGARKLIGYEMSVEDILVEVLKDKLFYETSGGGMTLSGGEPMFQFEFIKSLLKEAKTQGLHNCLDTCGFSVVKRYLEIAPYVDLFLFDIKETDPARHLEYTGGRMAPIHESLFALDQAGAKIVLRCPVIPGLNDREEHFITIAMLANQLRHIQAINILPYHPLGKSKSEQLGIAKLWNAPNFIDKNISVWIKTIQSETNVPVSGG